MRIYSMTATFGKLEHETLTLEPGLNIIDAPNEWGKSTWCAFLVTMLYGLDTRERTKKGSIADKERFAPWSGSPMSGRIDLQWNGRDITIERRTKGRVPMGELKAYETATGVAIPELTAANCGQTLLGVERSVFTRAGFIRSTDMPVTQDEDLRHRLNALVTTGDESGAAEELGQKLRDLKNRIRYNRKGLLPEAEEKRVTLAKKLTDHDELTVQAQRLRQRQAELEQSIHELENHNTALRYAAAQEDARRVTAAAKAREEAAARYQAAQSACEDLPSREAAMDALRKQDALRRQWDTLQAEERSLPATPVPPEIPEAFRGMAPAEALRRAEEDEAVMRGLDRPIRSRAPYPIAAGIAGAVLGVVLAVVDLPIPGLIALLLGVGLILFGVLSAQKARREKSAVQTQRLSLCRRYASNDPAQWVAQARRYQTDWERYHHQNVSARAAREELDARRRQLGKEMEDQDPTDYEAVMAAWDALAESRRALEQADAHLQTLQAMAKTAQSAPEPDTLTCSEQETAHQLSDAAAQLRQIQLRLGQCQGQMELLGSRETLRRELDAVEARIGELELTITALEYGLKALTNARAELQRRFAPRLTKQAQTLFARLTGGRYDRLTLAEDLSIHAGAAGEDTLRSHLWRSEGTVDQLYLALRLAVARELTPDAPLILDDALIRFDDDRLTTALQILSEEAKTRQVILFSCQGREKA